MGIHISNAFAPGITIKSGISPTGTYSISTNGLLDVARYSSISVNVKDLLDTRLQSKLNMSIYENKNLTYIAPYAFAYQNISSYSLPNVKYIDTGAFISAGCSNYNFPELEYIGEQAFSDVNTNTHISTFNAPKVKTIGSSAFYYASYLQSISFPECTTIYNSAFYCCYKLSSVYLPICRYIGSSAFYYCTSLQELNLPECSYIGSSAFYNCTKLVSVSLPNCSYIGMQAFAACSSGLTTFYAPNCISTGTGAVRYNPQLISLNLFNCTSWYSNICANNYNLPMVSIGPACSYIGMYAFENCYNLLSVYVYASSSIPRLETTAFTNTPISNNTTSTNGVYGKIYVPSSLYSAFISANVWSVYSARMVSM